MTCDLYYIFRQLGPSQTRKPGYVTCHVQKIVARILDGILARILAQILARILARVLARSLGILAADRRQRASVLLELISSFLACMQINAEISYARRRLDICKLFTFSTGQNGRQKKFKRVEKQCRPRRFWVRPGRTSAWWDNFVNPH